MYSSFLPDSTEQSLLGFILEELSSSRIWSLGPSDSRVSPTTADTKIQSKERRERKRAAFNLKAFGYTNDSPTFKSGPRKRTRFTQQGYNDLIEQLRRWNDKSGRQRDERNAILAEVGRKFYEKPNKSWSDDPYTPSVRHE